MVQEGLRKRNSFSLPSLVLGKLNQWLGIAPPETALMHDSRRMVLCLLSFPL